MLSVASRTVFSGARCSPRSACRGPWPTPESAIAYLDGNICTSHNVLLFIVVENIWGEKLTLLFVTFEENQVFSVVTKRFNNDFTDSTRCY